MIDVQFHSKHLPGEVKMSSENRSNRPDVVRELGDAACQLDNSSDPAKM